MGKKIFTILRSKYCLSIPMLLVYFFINFQAYHEATDEHDITTKFQMSPRGNDGTLRAFISKTGIPLYFDNEGNFRPEGPSREHNKSSDSANTDTDTSLHPLYFITANVHTLRVTSV